MPGLRREIIWLYDLEGNQVDAIGQGFLSGPTTDNFLDQSETLEFEVAADHFKAHRLIPDIKIVHRAKEYFISRVTEVREPIEGSSRVTVKVEANSSWYKLADQAWVGSLVLDEVTPAIGLITIISDSGWTFGDVLDTTDTFSMEVQDSNRLALIRQWSKVTGCVLTFDSSTHRISMNRNRGSERGLAFRYGRNIKGMTKRSLAPRVTRVWAYGADDLTLAGINGGREYIEDFTYYTDMGLSGAEAAELYTKSQILNDSSITTERGLLTAAQALLDVVSQPEVVYELDVMDLSEISQVLEEAEPGDIVSVYDPDFADNLRPWVTRYRREYLEPWNNKIELSTVVGSVTDGNTSSRPTRSAQWIQFPGPIRANYLIRNDGDYVVSALPLRFRDGGRCDTHLDLWAVGVGAGDLVVEVVDTEDEDAVQFKPVTIPYTDGETVRVFLTWATENLNGSHRFAVRVTTVASGGPSPSLGVDITADTTTGIEEQYVASYWIKAQGAVQETPTFPNSERFDWLNDEIQQFQVPDNIQQVHVKMAGAAGYDGGGAGSSAGGQGGEIEFDIAVVPGNIIDVYCGNGGPTHQTSGGWPGGGDAEPPDAGGGGGFTAIVEEGGSLSNPLALVGAGGGGADLRVGQSQSPTGGVGGFFNGGDSVFGDGDDTNVATGATQVAGGTGSPHGNGGEDGSFLQGGQAGNSDAFQAEGGGGGGGWYGGGGGAGSSSNACGGSGGSGKLRDGLDVLNLLVTDGANTGKGYVEFSWETPEIL